MLMAAIWSLSFAWSKSALVYEGLSVWPALSYSWPWCSFALDFDENEESYRTVVYNCSTGKGELNSLSLRSDVAPVFTIVLVHSWVTLVAGFRSAGSSVVNTALPHPLFNQAFSEPANAVLNLSPLGTILFVWSTLGKRLMAIQPWAVVASGTLVQWKWGYCAKSSRLSS
jgi:hypothetical protein